MYSLDIKNVSINNFKLAYVNFLSINLILLVYEDGDNIWRYSSSMVDLYHWIQLYIT